VVVRLSGLVVSEIIVIPFLEESHFIHALWNAAFIDNVNGVIIGLFNFIILKLVDFSKIIELLLTFELF
jgi:hypothetical protein